ncbi:hypothetical protein EI555_020838 [Monodon monoceros]|uniref:Glucosamine-6-phosphate isomerase n=1 Tax=Monodon monoceros TaxID=40151 RepID=A0A4U1F0E7_MONMO|nr:hypothetical protein EI555_020838 [Monodon monoceros]
MKSFSTESVMAGPDKTRGCLVTITQCTVTQADKLDDVKFILKDTQNSSSHQCILLLFDCKLLKVLYNGIFSGLNFLSWKLCITIMRLVILDNYDLASEWAAKYICNRIIQFRPGQDRYFTLGLPTGNAPFFSILGSTPLGCYKKLIEYHKNGDLSFKYVKTFNMDEYVGLPRNHPESYHSYMWNNFFKHIDIDPNNAHILDGNATDLQAECDAFEKKIKEAGGIDLFVGGIGPDGHIAFNEPGSSLVSRTRVKTLAMDTILANAKYFDGDLSKVPTMALTVGVGTVMDAREVMILITGAHKAFALYKAIEEGVNHMWTVSAFQQHPRTIFVCDEDATLELRVKTVKYFKGEH